MYAFNILIDGCVCWYVRQASSQSRLPSTVGTLHRASGIVYKIRGLKLRGASIRNNPNAVRQTDGLETRKSLLLLIVLVKDNIFWEILA